MMWYHNWLLIFLKFHCLSVSLLYTKLIPLSCSVGDLQLVQYEADFIREGLLVVVLRSSETSFGEWMVMVWRCFGETWDFSFTFCIYLALQEFCTRVVSLDRSPRYSKLLRKRIGFIRYHGTFIFCGWRFCMRIMLMSVPWAHSVQRYVALAHAQAMYLYCVCFVLKLCFSLFR